MLWALVLYLTLEMVPAFIVKLVLNKPFGELVGPYVAFAMPGMVFVPLAWWLRQREGKGLSSRSLALGWGLYMALFVSLVTSALFYSGAELQVIKPKST